MLVGLFLQMPSLEDIGPMAHLCTLCLLHMDEVPGTQVIMIRAPERPTLVMMIDIPSCAFFLTRRIRCRGQWTTIVDESSVILSYWQASDLPIRNKVMKLVSRVWTNNYIPHILVIGHCALYNYKEAGLIPGLRPANERRHYKVTPFFIGWAQT